MEKIVKEKLYLETSVISYFVARTSRDVLQIAIATLYQMDFLVSWNCKHIANAQVIKKLTASETMGLGIISTHNAARNPRVTREWKPLEYRPVT
ncbi:MAG: hypothetical protein WA705_26175 [Candidatus Ozemobacteraceae bacterium]